MAHPARLLADPELVSTPLDKNVNGIPRHASRRKQGLPPAQGLIWKAEESTSFESPAVVGGYPRGFVAWACEVLGVKRQGMLLHMCSGGVPRAPRHVRIDIRTSQRPDVVADARRLPLADACVEAVLIDPPYSLEYAEKLYQTDYPRPSHLLAEAARVLKPGGLVGLLHYLVPNPVAGLRFAKVYGLTYGLGLRIRALTIFQRPRPTLFDGGGA